MSISSISNISVNGVQSVVQTAKTTKTDSLGESFNQVLNSLNESQNNADTLLTQLASGEDVDLSELMIATTENDVNFRVAMAIRDKLVDAYRQINQMNI